MGSPCLLTRQLVLKIGVFLLVARFKFETPSY